MSASLFEESEGIELQTEMPGSMVAPGEVLLGVLAGIDSNGSPIVGFPQLPHFEPTTALATIPVLPQHIGRQVALLFTQGADSRPIVIGFLYSPLQQMLDNLIEQSSEIPIPVLETMDQTVFDEPVTTSTQTTNADLHGDTVHVDGKRVVLEGQEEVVLKCGEASITLTRNGKVVIRGKYLLSRSSGVNRILGGSVQVN
jgi:hypothetical protein